MSEQRDQMQQFYQRRPSPPQPRPASLKLRPMRRMALAIGIGLVLGWVAIFVALLTDDFFTTCGYRNRLPDCGDVHRGTFFFGVLASPILIPGLLLIGTGVGRSDSGQAGWMRRMFQACLLILSAGFSWSALVFLPDVEVVPEYFWTLATIAFLAWWAAHRVAQ